VGIGAPCQSIASVDTSSGPSEGPQIGASVSLANIPECDRQVFCVPPRHAYEADGFSAVTPQRSGAGWSVIMLFCSFTSQSYVGEYLEYLKDAHPNAELIGGFVGGKESWIFKGGEVSSHGGIVGMAIGGNVVYSSQVSRACKKVRGRGVPLSIDEAWCDVVVPS